MFPNKDWKRDALKVLTDLTGTTDRSPDSGRIDIRTVVDLALSAQLLSSTKLKICHETSKESCGHTELCAVCLQHLK